MEMFVNGSTAAIHSVIHSFVCSLVHSFIHLFVLSFIHPSILLAPFEIAEKLGFTSVFGWLKLHRFITDYFLC